jgi:phosphopantothenoylcysteine decarboxylase / phosphopantothenate---cysteine ligase
VLSGKHILLGVTGSIAAYKSAWLVRELVKAGAEVQVVMTQNATRFLPALTLSTLSRREALVDMFPPPGATGDWTRHIELGLWADVMFIAPATANTIAKIANGVADDFLTTLVLALRCPLALAPAMDVDMYQHESTQRNLDALRQSGCLVIDPEQGELASGLSGPGRLPEIDRLVAFVDGILERTHQDMKGKNVLVTAGPTYEPVDPVRFLGNRSSGKMGFALAAAAAQRGADVTLIAGPVQLRTPRHVRRIDVETTAEMQEAVEQEFGTMDLVIMAAAVSDFHPLRPEKQKIKREARTDGRMTLELAQNPDILKRLGEKKTRQVLVGFALETDNGPENARRKLAAKNLDLIVLNNPLEPGAGFGTDTNIITVVTPGAAPEALPRMSKFDAAHEILRRAVVLLKH